MAPTRRGRKHKRMSRKAIINDSEFLHKLPEDIHIMILDKLPMKEAVATSKLSRTWRGLWKFMSKVDFRYQWVQEVGKEITPSVDQFVHQHQGQKLRSCRVSLRHFKAATRSGLTSAQYGYNFHGLLDVFQTAKSLHLCSWAIQVLSIKKVINQEILSFNLTQLVLDTGLLQWELPGIAYLLRACPWLENLVISMESLILLILYLHEFQFNNVFNREYDFDVESYWRQRVICLERLHSVEFKNPFAYCQTRVDFKVYIQNFFTGFENGVELFGFLLKNSPNLKRLAFNRETFVGLG